MITDYIPTKDVKELDRFIEDLDNSDIIKDRILSWLIAIERIDSNSTHSGWVADSYEVENLESDLRYANDKIEDLENEIEDLEEDSKESSKTIENLEKELRRAEQELERLNKKFDLLGE